MTEHIYYTKEVQTLFNKVVAAEILIQNVYFFKMWRETGLSANLREK